MKNNNSIETLVAEYQRNADEVVFCEIYEAIRADVLDENMTKSFARKTGISEDLLLEMFDEAVMYTIGALQPGQVMTKLVAWKFKALRIDYIREARRGINKITDRLTPQYNKDGEDIEIDFKSEYDLEGAVIESMTAKKKADQRQLIDFLLNGADATTTAIVEAFLAHPKPSATAIAKELGFHHSKVTRSLNRLAAKFNTKQFGDYHDYLVAFGA